MIFFLTLYDLSPSLSIMSIMHCSHLSGMNLTGDIPLGLTKLSALTEIWLDANSLQGSIPDFSSCSSLKIIHLENNQLTGELPSYLSKLPNLQELYVQNNMLSGKIPKGLLSKNLPSNFSGNKIKGVDNGKSRSNITLWASVGAALLLIATLISCILIHKRKKSYSDRGKFNDLLPPKRLVTLSNATTDAAHCFMVNEILEATQQFRKKIGSGGFGVVYYVQIM
uniref:Uncharacterized protein n=1 Tax=Kalanchoe fedtschenkoi TaxID=63787 RepID=A0A7N0UJY0_KALFE